MTLKKLLLFTVALCLMLFSQANAANVDTVKAAIVKYSVEMGVDPAITLSIAKAESGFKHEVRSAHGAVGVFQLMPSTARRMGLNPYSLDDNIKAGIMYYKSMYKMFGSMQLAVAAYNAGPANVKKYNAVPPFRETKRFVSQIMADYYYLKAHTDPAVIAFNKEQKAKLQQQNSAKALKDGANLSKTVTQQIVATAPAVSKTPVSAEKTKSTEQVDISDISPKDSVEM
ncbi:lytic transglycosylase domain-containing protein [bacterium]|nr:lytic transglycosylase domain-containing protein [bacterium]